MACILTLLPVAENIIQIPLEVMMSKTTWKRLKYLKKYGVTSFSLWLFLTRSFFSSSNNKSQSAVTSNMAGLWSPQKFASNQNKIQVLYGVCNGSTYLHVVVFSWSRAQNWVILSHIMITNPCGGYLVNPHMIKKLWYFIVNPEGRLFEWQWNNSATLNWCCENWQLTKFKWKHWEAVTLFQLNLDVAIDIQKGFFLPRTVSARAYNKLKSYHLFELFNNRSGV